MSKEPNYTEAFEELQEIVLEIEQGEISVDALSEKVKRAAVLIKICKAKLYQHGRRCGPDPEGAGEIDRREWMTQISFL